MIKQITSEEIDFMEGFYNPKCMVESLFTKPANGWMEGLKCILVRLYQIPFLQYDSLIEDDENLSEQENFTRRINAGTLILISARKLGKTFLSLAANILLKLVHYSGKEMTMASYDESHVDKVLDDTREFLYAHGFFKLYRKNIKGSPEYKIETHNGNIMYGVNETIKGKSPGENWWGKHTEFNFQDEIQAETEDAFLKKIDAVGEKGVVENLCGIPLITKVSPLGKLLRDHSRKNSIVRIPQSVSPFWNETVRKDRIKNYGGENSIAYRVNCLAELIEGAMGCFDMERVRKNYTSRRIIKKFEVTKENFCDYQNFIILEKHPGASKTFIFSDIGDTAATEIGVIFEVNDKLIYTYNITTYRLSDKENSDFMAGLFKALNATNIAVDATIMGKPVYRQLCEALGAEKVSWCAFNESMIVGFERDEKTDKVKVDAKGKPIEKFENTLIFSVQQLRNLFYEQRFDIPEDDVKFEDEFSSYLQTISGNRVVFDSTTDDHLVQAFQVFAVMYWKVAQLPGLNPNVERQKLSLGVFN
jgi:hypothetical protein